ncbi:NADH-quinone oxidoreductase subunit L [Sulfurovum sp.]|uniref:NADH-quinone oxidoreductase subunit L n=1 Tax=Sulfurovum sp. TaxID=1969726 RepID=UPI002868373E|nr:NADH-quinone oxidoreductase subunit L [Sulfurovum sp.]
MNTSLLIWIILSPLLGAILNGGFYIYHIKIQKVPEILFSIIGTVFPFLAFVFTFILFLEMNQSGIVYSQHLFMWIDIDKLTVPMQLLGDNLSIFMSLFVTFVGTLIHLYAVAYMKGDEGFGKFFAYFNLFLASMLLLVLADNPIILFIGWEGVGVCSYLLISFYYKSKENVIAGNKAFIVNRVGDLGFLLGVITLFFALNKTGISFGSMQLHIHEASEPLLILSGILLFVGAMGKSAQIPLYTWLPDAMLGPTPISALIHAATMVTAGVYMVARFHFLYEGIPNVGVFIAYIGAFSALFAAIIATRQTDIKKILAYSTMSQLGYMFIAVGLGLYSSGLFHVFTHAFFKAMLFMGAGGLILAIHHEQDIFELGKHRMKLPIISVTFLIGVIAISGIPPFSGFFSKDAILAGAFASEHYLLWGMGLFTAFLTAFYMFRLYFILFVAPNQHESKRHNTPWSIGIPLFVLAIGAMFAGFINLPEVFGGGHHVDNWLAQLQSHPHTLSHTTEYFLIFASVSVALLGMFVAYKRYANYDFSKRETEEGLIYNKFYVDEVYDVLFVKSTKRISSFFSDVMDTKIIDAILMGLSRSFVAFGRGFTFLQNANVRYYAFYMLMGMSAISYYVYTKLQGV